MSDLGIKFINADEGGLLFTINTHEGQIKRRADSVEDVAHWINFYGVSTSAYFSSDMDFASDEGFLNDGDAKKMWYAGEEAA